MSASPAPSSDLVFTITSGGFRVGGGEITTAGSGRAIISVPTATGLYTLSVSADGYTTKQVTFTASAQTVPTPTPTPTLRHRRQRHQRPQCQIASRLAVQVHEAAR